MATFKTWQTWVINYFDQDPIYEQFLPGGRYENWIAASLAPRGHKGRINGLFVKGPDTPTYLKADVVDDKQVMAAAEKVLAGSYATMQQADKVALKTELADDRLALRNRQLNKLLQVLSSLVWETEREQVVKESTSLEWIWNLLKRRYNIETRGSNFLKIANVTFKQGTEPMVFYHQLLHAFQENLRKVGDVRNHLVPGDVMDVDEALSPSFRDAIVLLTLERIDPRLPARVARDYEHRLDKKTHLTALASSIFQAVPAMIESLDRDAGLNALASQSTTATMDAFAARGRGRGAPKYQGQSRYQGQGRGATSRQQPRISPTTGRPWTLKMCRICEGEKRSPAVVASHNTVECDSLSKSELRGFLASLQAMDLTANNQEEDQTFDANETTEGDGDAGVEDQELAQRPHQDS